MTDEQFQLYDPDGRRKYLTTAERNAFLSAAETAPREVRTFSMVLAYTGCRISEALALTADRVDLTSHTIIFETLKKRRRGIYRAVPVPPALTDALNLAHAVREAQNGRGGGRDQLLWPFSRTTAWRYVQEILNRAGLAGPQASPKGFRHGFGVQAVAAGIPLNLVQKWLGHAQLSTTAIYADAVGDEEHQIMEKMWG
ncbi:MAG: site-specific integrase [Hyphomicrobiales bacterium]|nr:site-specific integrase [Hyphomicrobiales bacterium]